MEYFSSNFPICHHHSSILARNCRLLLDREEVQRRRKSHARPWNISLASLHLEAYNFTGQSSFFCLPSKPKAREHKSPFRIFLELPLKVVRRTGGLFSSCDGFAHKSKSVFAPLHSVATVG